jgi:hypothetical protein
MKTRVIVVAMLALLIPALAFAQVGPYTQDFEGLATAPEAGGTSMLGGDGWLYFVNVFNSGGGYLYGYGTGPAPNAGTHMSAVVEGEGGGAQEFKQLSIFSDYGNLGAHDAGDLVETNIFQERVLDASNVAQTWTMAFDAKMGNLEGATTAAAFIKTLNPNDGYATTNFILTDMTLIPNAWGGYSVSLYIDPGLVGQIFQFGFTNTAANYEGSGVFYDNVNLSDDGTVATEEASFGGVKALFR